MDSKHFGFWILDFGLVRLRLSKATGQNSRAAESVNLKSEI
jgi:hypothetical protein